MNFLIKLSFIHYNTHIAHMFYKVIAHLRYFLGGHRPSETSILTNLNKEKYSYHLIYSKLKIFIPMVIEIVSPIVHKNTKAI